MVKVYIVLIIFNILDLDKCNNIKMNKRCMREFRIIYYSIIFDLVVYKFR